MTSASIPGYRVIRELGRGAMGVVYEVECERTHERYAAKVMTLDAIDRNDRPDLVERFRREARAAALIPSENVVWVLETGAVPQPFLIMELLHGATTRELIASKGPFSPHATCTIVAHAADALDRAHAAGIVHRDIKPDNLFLHRRKDGRQMVKVLDFGVARVLDEDATAITATGAAIGTLPYMSPEQTTSEPHATGPRSDIWSMGMTTIDLLTGEGYWPVMKPSQLVPKVMAGDLTPPSARWPRLPRAFDDWFLRSCARQPDDRFASHVEQAAALRAAIVRS